jgi:hypothetical protein
VEPDFYIICLHLENCPAFVLQGKGKVKKGMKGDLIQALLSFDP